MSKRWGFHLGFVMGCILLCSSTAAYARSYSRLIVATAKHYLGYPYVYGDEGTYGYDCSGFVQTVFRHYGFKLPRTSRQQIRVGTPVSRFDIRPGDLLFFTTRPGSSHISHVGIAIGHDMMIHAARGGRAQVMISKLHQPYYSRRLVAARRLTQLL